MKVLVVCAQKYNGHELWTALGVMQEAGIDFEVVSQHRIIQDEITFQANQIERLVWEVPIESAHLDFDGIMIVSGNMKDTEKYWKDEHVLGIIDGFNAIRKPIAAICCSVPTIRFAAKGKKVSFFPLIRSRELLRQAGAILCTVAWTVDKNLVTAEHQMATQMWAGSFVKLLLGQKQTYKPLVESGYTPKGRSIRTPDAITKLRS